MGTPGRRARAIAVSALAAVLEGREVVVCAGPGGVGKTTSAAAIGLAMAARGRRVAVLTIDPARRLADSLGLEEIGGEERRVDP
ncbi:MAG: AAA family ATPase, partial [Thermoleophilaceae bacterium]|nr:AAA family ATPase [Thermoleophilaceae bacterium]